MEGDYCQPRNVTNQTVVCSTIDRGLGVLVGLCEERIDWVLRGEDSFRALSVDVAVVALRIVAGLGIVLLRIEARFGRFGRFGERTAKGSGLSMSREPRCCRFQIDRWRKQTGAKPCTNHRVTKAVTQLGSPI